mgnify:CR=1 FL=1
MDKQECKDLLSQLPASDFNKVKMLYRGIKGDTINEFVNNASDKQVTGIIKLCKIHLKK